MTLDNFPTTRPSFSVNFARSQQMPPQVNFTRATTGTYTNDTGLVVTAPVNVPRFNWQDGRCQGLLIELDRTNFCLHSAINPANWTEGGNSSLTVSTVPAPDGGTCHDLETDTGGANAVIVSNTSSPVGGDATLSVFARFPNAGFTSLAIRVVGVSGGANFYASYIPATDSWDDEASCTGLPSEDFGNGWKRLSVVSTVASTAGTNEVRIGGGINQTAFTGQTCQIWGAQLELGGYSTSYIPTTGSTATRARDVVQINNLDFWSDEATLTAEYQVKNANPYAFQWGFDQGTGAGGIQANPGAVTGMPHDGMLYITGTGDAEYMGGNNNAWVTGEPLKAAYSWDCSAGEYSGFINHGNATPITETGFAIVPPRTRFTFGAWGTDMRNSTVWSYMAYYPTRVSEDTLEALTQ